VIKVKFQKFRPLVPHTSTHCWAYSCGLSTGSSFRGLMRKPNLGVGFALRCFQRLSFGSIATRLCSWRNNRHTRGCPSPVLSSLNPSITRRSRLYLHPNNRSKWWVMRSEIKILFSHFPFLTAHFYSLGVAFWQK
jgi:hypothetical protein